MRLKVLAIALLCATAASAKAEPYVIYGAGTNSCGKWNTADGHRDRDFMTAWVLGWVTAAGYYQVHGTLQESDVNTIRGWLDNYCHSHPLDGMPEATGALIRALANKELSSI
jgi:hypothetical protein